MRKLHPLAELFPEMNPAEYEELKADIEKQGQLEPVLLHPICQRIVDGRHRARAVQELGLILKTIPFEGPPEALFDYVLSMNLRRRHLTASQKAVLALRVEKYEAEKASIRRKMTQNNKTGEKLRAEEALLPPQRGKARDIASKIVGVSARYITDAKKIESYAPHLLEKVSRGELTIKRAVLEADRASRKKLVSYLKREKPQTYQVLYADPPWFYGETQDRFEKDLGLAIAHYETIKDRDLAEILQKLELEIADNAVCFLWTTNPMLPRALEILKRWGFNYKTNLCWVKNRPFPAGLGFYFRSQHEILLLGTKGSFQPLTKEVISSVFSQVPREHSRKPDEIYEIVEKLYPDCNYLELFGRTQRKGWDCYGNQLEKF